MSHVVPTGWTYKNAAPSRAYVQNGYRPVDSGWESLYVADLKPGLRVFAGKRTLVQQNMLLHNLAILFIRHRLQHSHKLDYHWPWSGLTTLSPIKDRHCLSLRRQGASSSGCRGRQRHDMEGSRDYNNELPTEGSRATWHDCTVNSKLCSTELGATSREQNRRH